MRDEFVMGNVLRDEFVMKDHEFITIVPTVNGQWGEGGKKGHGHDGGANLKSDRYAAG